eukprot:TRINITY_DN2833_c0_g3_i2.p1 TRINITY_DN2833_c0_g3~~TRINITY_DN2833_c0_g3_i2.p1  ORF type:complete len:362 (-),score=172.02 TRINITY_DN2833_c0_g3_i2:24-1109(-)
MGFFEKIGRNRNENEEEKRREQGAGIKIISDSAVPSTLKRFSFNSATNNIKNGKRKETKKERKMREEREKEDEMERFLKREEDKRKHEEEMRMRMEREMERLRIIEQEEGYARRIEEEKKFILQQEMERKEREMREEEEERARKTSEFEFFPDIEGEYLSDGGESDDDDDTEERFEQERIQRENELRNKSGYLWKEGHLWRSWQHRFFVIQDEEMFYWTDSSKTTLKGSFPLRNAKVNIVQSDDDKSFCFFVETCINKNFLISAASEMERKEWMEAIHLVSQGFLKEHFEEETDFMRRMRASMGGDLERKKKSGWLEKEGHVRRNWTRRFFYLSNSHFTDSIIYYGNELVFLFLFDRDCSH